MAVINATPLEVSTAVAQLGQNIRLARIRRQLGLMGTTTALADPDADEHGKILEAARRPRRARQPAAGDSDF
jgi:hypothetical protein